VINHKIELFKILYKDKTLEDKFQIYFHYL